MGYMEAHSWGPSRLNHGSQQCTKCHCTYEEALYARLTCTAQGPKVQPQLRVVQGGKADG